MNDLFVEKTAAAAHTRHPQSNKTIPLPVEQKLWPREILKAALDQNPWLANYSLEVHFVSMDPEEKTAVGRLVVARTSPRPTDHLSQSTPPIPVEAGEHSGQGTQGTPAEIVHRLEASPASIAFVIYKGRLNPVDLLVRTSQQIGAHLEPLNERRLEKALGGAQADFTPSMEREPGANPVSVNFVGPMTEKVSGAVHPEDLEATKALVAEAGSAHLLSKLAALEPLPARSANVAAPDTMYLRREPKGVHIKVASSRAYDGVDTDLITVEQGWHLASLRGIPREDLEKVGSGVLITHRDLEDGAMLYEDPGLPRLLPDSTPHDTPGCIHTPAGAKRGMHVLAKTASGRDARVFYGDGVASMLGPEVSGAGPEVGDEVAIDLAVPVIGSTGVFRTPEGKALEPVKVAGITVAKDQIWVDAEPLSGSLGQSDPLRIVFIDKVAGIFVDTDKNEAWMPLQSTFTPVQDLVRALSPMEEKTAAIDVAEGLCVSLVGSGDGTHFAIYGAPHLTKDAGTSLAPDEVVFHLALMGLTKTASEHLMSDARRQSRVRFVPPHVPKTASAVLNKYGSVSLRVAKAITDLRPAAAEYVPAVSRIVERWQDGAVLSRFVKLASIEAGALESERVASGASAAAGGVTDTLGDLLSVTFLSPENISTFLDAIPVIESQIRLLALLLYGSYLGLEIDSADLKTSISTLDRIVRELTKIRMRMEMTPD